MQNTINTLYSLFVNDGYSLNAKNIIRKNTKVVLPDALKQHIAVTFGNIDLAATINDTNLVEIYNGVVSKFKTAVSVASNDTEKEVIDIMKFLPDRYAIMNRNLFNFFKDNIVYARDENGTVITLARKGDKGNVWRIVNDLISGIMMHHDLNGFTKLHTNMMQSPLRGQTFMVCNGDGSSFGVRDWAGVIDIAVAKAKKWLEENSETHQMPTDSYIKFMKTARTLDPTEDPTILPTVGVTCTPKTATGYIATQWEREAELCVQMPETITNNPEIPAFCYIDLDELTDGPTPEFDGFMTSVEDVVRGPFMACIYASIFDKAHHSLVTWLHGEGSNGKSQFFSAINEYFGGTLVGSMSTKSLSGDFGLEGLIGKRLIIWGDCQNGNALSTNEVHGITGGDFMSVNRKNKPIIDYKFNSVLFIGANKPPEIKMNAVNETRRVLYVPMHDPDVEVMRKYCEYDEKTGVILRQSTGQPIFKSYDLKGKLVKEMPHIMYKCKEMFFKYCKAPYNQITVPPEAFELMVNKCEGGQNLVFNDFIASRITVTGNKNDYITAKDFNSEYLAHVYGDNARNLIQKYNYELSDLKRFLTTAFDKIDFERKYLAGTKVSCYTGLKFGVAETKPTKIVGFSDEVQDAEWC